jgi:hypothetical protein
MGVNGRARFQSESTPSKKAESCFHFESVFWRNVAAAGGGGREFYIPLVPQEARAAFHSALASFMKMAADPRALSAGVGCHFRRAKVCCPGWRHHPFVRLAEQKV